MIKDIVPAKYEFLQIINENLNSKILKVIDMISRETRVLKIVFPESPFYRGFYNEFTFIKENEHPNLIDIYNFGYLPNGYLYYEMPYYEQIDPEKYCEKGKVCTFLSIFWQILQGLNFLHERGKLHGDISRDNIFVMDDNGKVIVKISDFGLSSLIVAQNISQISGTAYYMAPELLSNTERAVLSPQTDLYSLGIYLCSILSGKRMFSTSDPMEIMKEKITKSSFDLIPAFTIHDELINIIKKMVSKKPGARFQSCFEVINAIYPYLIEYKISINQEKYLLSSDNIHLFRLEKISNIARYILKRRINKIIKPSITNFKEFLNIIKAKISFEHNFVVTIKNLMHYKFHEKVEELILDLLPADYSFTGKKIKEVPMVIIVTTKIWNNYLSEIEIFLKEFVNSRFLIIQQKDQVTSQQLQLKINSIRFPDYTNDEFDQYLDKIFGNKILPDELRLFFHKNCARNIELLFSFLKVTMNEKIIEKTNLSWKFDLEKIEFIKIPGDLISKYSSNYFNLNQTEKFFLVQLAFMKSKFTYKDIEIIFGYKMIHIQDYVNKLKKFRFVLQPSGKIQFRYDFIKKYFRENASKESATHIKQIIIDYLQKKSTRDSEESLILCKYLKEIEQYDVMIKLFDKDKKGAISENFDILGLFFSVIDKLKIIDKQKSVEIFYKYLKGVHLKKEFQEQNRIHQLFEIFVSDCNDENSQNMLLTENFDWLNINGKEQEKIDLFEANKNSISSMSQDLKYNIYYAVMRAYSVLGNMKKTIELGIILLQNPDIEPMSKIRLLFQISDAYGALNQFDEYYSTLIQAKEISEKINFTRGLIYANLLLAIRDFENLKNTSGIKFFKKAVSLNKYNSKYDFDFTINFAQYRYFLNMGKYYDAFKLLIKDKDSKIDFKKGFFHYYEISEILINLGYYKQASCNIDKAISLLPENNRLLLAFLSSKLRVSLYLEDELYLKEAKLLLEKYRGNSYISDVIEYELLLLKGYIFFDQMRNATEKCNEITNKYSQIQMLMINKITFMQLQALLLYKKDKIQTSLNFTSKSINLLESVKNNSSNSYETYYSAYQIFKEAFSSKISTENYKKYLKTAYKIAKKRIDFLPNNKMKRTFSNIKVIAGIIEDYEKEVLNLKNSGMETILLDVLEEISHVIKNVSDKKKLFSEILKIVLKITKADRGVIITLDNESLEQKIEYSYQVSKDSLSDIALVNKELVENVFKKKKAVFSTKVASNNVFDPYQSFVNLKIDSIVCLPMIIHKQILGTIYLDSTGLLAFTPEEIKFLNILAQVAASAIETSQNYNILQCNNKQMEDILNDRNTGHENIIGNSPQIQKIFKKIEQIAPTDVNVLVEGESGTGKELVAKDIHKYSKRCEKIFIPVDCGSLSENVIESELFGHKKGAFTGAISDKRGIFEEANKGTIFLDEISNLSMNTQIKLLRLIQEGEFKRVGENHVRKVNVRIIAATNVALKKLVEEGKFRQDLYYRLSIFPIVVPSLRNRKSDIMVLSKYFLKYNNVVHKKNIKGIRENALELLEKYNWPGNVRQLQNEIERSVIVCNNLWLDREEFSHLISEKDEIPIQIEGKIDFNDMVDNYKITLIKHALKENKNNWSKAAENLNISRQSMRRMFKRITEEN